MSALKRTGDAQASLEKQFDRHNCEPDDSGPAAARVTADVLLRREPDEEEDEEEDDRKKEDDDDDDETNDGYSE
jgi:hypothetical protein